MTSFISSQKLHALTEKVRSKPISWEGYSRAGLISSEDVQLIQKAPTLKQSLPDKHAEFLQLYIKLLHDLNRNDTIAYVLVLLGDMMDLQQQQSSVLDDAPARSKLYDNLTPLLTDATDDFIKLKAAAILSTLLAADAHPPQETLRLAIHGLFALLDKASSTSEEEIQQQQKDVENYLVALQALGQLFKKSDARQWIWAQRVTFIPTLESLLKSVVAAASKFPAPSSAAPSGTATPRSGSASAQANSGSSSAAGLAASTALAAAASAATADISSPQLQYTLVLAIWILTYEPDIASGLNDKYHSFIPLLAELARVAVKEKVVRVVLATFRNLTTLAPQENLPAMLSAKLLPYLQSVSSSRRWSDEEVKEDAAYLKEQLQSLKKGLTTFDEYQQELESGLLRWSTPTHQDEDFWRENAKKLESDNKRCVKTLVSLLSTSQDPTVLAIACNDLAQYVKHTDTGRKTVDSLGGKTKAMELMSFKDSDVRYNALTAVQRLVSHSWA